MESKNLIILFEGDDVFGRSKLFDVFNKETDSNYYVLNSDIIGRLLYFEIFNKSDNTHVLSNIVKLLRKNFDIIIVYVTANSTDENGVYNTFFTKQFSMMHDMSPEDRIAIIEKHKEKHLYWLQFIVNVSSSDKLCETKFCTLTNCNDNVEIKNTAKELKEEIDKIINKK